MNKQKKHSVLKRVISVAIMSSLCLTAAIGVATFTQTVSVSDITADVTEKETEAQAKYNKALKAGVSLEELKNAKKGKKKRY